jgi:hypothetical protein
VKFIVSMMSSLCANANAPTQDEIFKCVLVSADMYSQFCALDNMGIYASAGGVGERSKDWFFTKITSALAQKKSEYFESVQKRMGSLPQGSLKVYVTANGAPPDVFSPLHLVSQAFALDHVHPTFRPISPTGWLHPGYHGKELGSTLWLSLPLPYFGR